MGTKKRNTDSIILDRIKKAIEKECQKERYTFNAMKGTRTPSTVTFRIMLDKSKPTKNGNRYGG